VPVATAIVPSAAIEKPDGAPTRLSTTSVAAGVVPFSVSLPSTLDVALPAATGAVMVSSTATRVPLLTLRVAVAWAQMPLSGAARHTW